MSAQIELGGQVISGRGRAAPELFGLSEELHAIVKEPLYPGSLNIVLNRPLRLLNTAAFTFDGESRMLWPASLNGVDVWIYRWRESPLHIVEVLSSIHLRERLKLKDGDDVILRLRDKQIGAINPIGRLTWAVLWIGRRQWVYSNYAYYSRTMGLCTKLGATQQEPIVKGLVQTSFVVVKDITLLVKRIIKRTPVIGTLARRIKSKLAGDVDIQGYIFSRIETDGCADDDERQFRQIRNVLNYTKTSNSIYSAQQFPAGYQTININGQQVLGQRDPSRRLALVPADFHGKTVLDLGCNQGGMIHQLAPLVKWAVGVDYDPRMVNAANRVKNAIGANNTSFYVLDLQREPLELISDFLPDQRVDICFLLSVCMWLDNWQEVIDFAHVTSNSMLFETNGDLLQQQQQIDYLRTRYQGVKLLSETSEDDPSQKDRKLFYLTDPVSLSSSVSAQSISAHLPQRKHQIVEIGDSNGVSASSDGCRDNARETAPPLRTQA